ncbi:MAG: choice-of-anchor tandem repeat GloVer-containing protein, partial [Limisphaerales bacterium]
MTSFSALRAFGVGLWITLSASAQTFTLVRSFNPADGASPAAGVVQSGGVLYGTTTALGPNNGGTVFKVKPDGTGYTVLWSFTPPTDGGLPMCDLVVSGGTVYGTASVGGANNGGTVFVVSTNGTGFTVLKAFDSSLTAEGNTPAAGLVLSGTTLYGTTQFGGNGGNGTIFKVNTDGSGFSTLHPMLSAASDGAFPQSIMVLSGSTLYGTASGGGPSGFGTVFSMNTDGSGYTVIKYLAGPPTEGRNPVGGLLLSGGVLYGTTASGGSSDFGTVFKINPDGTGFSVLRQFAGATTDGGLPEAFLILSGTTLYGTTFQGGSSDVGTLFKLNTDGSGYGTLYTFLATATVPPTFPNGRMPNGGLLSYNGVFYGLANGGGANDMGALYSLTVPNSPPVVTTTGTTLSHTEGSGPVAVDPGITVTDVDNTTLASATVSITGNFKA